MKFSIITVNYNNDIGLRDTIDSVRRLTFKDYEYIVIDGGSTDNSVDIIKDNLDIIQHWVSEKDNGTYDAMNKGVKIANGDYCIFMNSGDTFASPSILEKVPMTNDFDIICGNANVKVGENGYVWTAPKSLTEDFWHSRFYLCHQAVFIKTVLLKECPYDTTFKIAADYYFFAYQTFANKISYKKIDFIVCNYDGSGISSNDGASDDDKIKALDKLQSLGVMKEDELLHLCKKLKFGGRRYKLALFVIKFLSK